MRWNEEKVQPEKKPKKEEKKEIPKKATDKDYDYYDLGKLKPMRGGNPWS